MVLESLINPFSAKKNLFHTFLYGFLYSSIGLFLGLWVFRDHTSLIMVFFTVMFVMPLMYFTIKEEEQKDFVINDERKLLSEHRKALTMLVVLFFGFIVAFSLWYVVLPAKLVSVVYSTQSQTIANINSQISGHVTVSLSTFLKILSNNLKVLTFSILFSFIFGFGAIFILTWNASVVSTAIGNFIRVNIVEYANTFGFVTVADYFKIVSLSLFRYMVHGIPEMTAYFVGGLAGGIISVAVIRKHFYTSKFENILFDSSQLVLIAVMLLVIAGLIEVFVIPGFF